MFKVDYSGIKTNDFEPLPAGEYEMIIHDTQEKATKNGKEAFNVQFAVRPDLKHVPELAETNGKYANRRVFYDEWKRDINGKYQYKVENFQYLFQAAGIPEGTEINSMDDLHDLLYHKPVRVYVKKEFSDYRNDYENTVAPWNIKPTKYPKVTYGEDDAPFKPSGVDVEDEELPF